MTASEIPAAAGPGRWSSLPRRLIARVAASLREPEQVLALILIGAFILRAIWLTLPAGTLIFDEAYYVNAARTLLGWTVPTGAHYAGSPVGLDPNTEHPPLGKVLMAGSMLLFGDNGLGWRVPSLIAGMVALGALYWIVRASGESAWFGTLAVGFFALDNLSLVHGRIGTLDMLVLAPILLAAWATQRAKWIAAGALAGLGFLMKLTALYGLLAILILESFAVLRIWRANRTLRFVDLRPIVLTGVAFVVVGGVGLWLLDARFTTYTNPLEHVRHMLEYGAGLTKASGPPTTCASNDSAPWQWLVNDCQMNYLRTAVNITDSSGKLLASNASIDFRGAMNPGLLAVMWLAVPFAAWWGWRKGSRVAQWSIVWIAANYLPFIPLALIGHRITYIYYFLPLVPAVSVAAALLLLRSGLPRVVQWAFVIAYVFGFAALYPFRQIP